MKYELNEHWILKTAQGEFPTQIPSSFYTVLLEQKKIPDPYYRDNEYAVRDLARENIEYFREFVVNEELLIQENIFLVFECLDTLTEVYINNKKIAKTDNMFSTWRFDIKKYLQFGKNTLCVKIFSPIIAAEKKEDAMSSGWALPANITMRGYAHIRKAHCSYGWDWGPQLPDMGIYRSVYIEAYSGNKLENFLVQQEHRDDGSVVLNVQLEFSHGQQEGLCTLCVTAPDGHKTKSEFFAGEASITIEKPELWWPNGYGAQTLYTLILEYTNGTGFKQIKSEKIGLRTLTVSTAPDQWGAEFCFVVNGLKIFSMGADYIPEDNLIPRMSKLRTEKLIQSCIDANFNSIRVWGGAYYPDDYFFELCDQYGLLVWQDFMFACGVYNLSHEFEKSITKEFTDNIKRIRNHACLGLLCGNNEMEVAWVEWGLPKNEKLRTDYILMFERILPGICAELAPQIFYWPASPSSGGGFLEPNGYDKGDVHYWEVWHGNKPFEEYRKYHFRYCSEFGFEAFPALKTIRSFAEEKDLNPFSLVLESHQKCIGGNKKILAYLADYYLYPKDFAHFVYASQLLQADAIKYGVEHFRRYRGRCMGAIYWQLNDIWPGPSWASVDYFGRWKALHYFAKKFFAPVLLSAHLKDNQITLNVSNEQRVEFKGTIKYGLCNNDFKILASETIECTVLPLSACDVTHFDVSAIQGQARRETYFYYELFDQNNSHLCSESLLLVQPKHYNFVDPQITTIVTESAEEFFVRVTAQHYARSVELEFTDYDCILADNYFDLISGESKEIKILRELQDRELTLAGLQKSLQIKSVYSIA